MRLYSVVSSVVVCAMLFAVLAGSAGAQVSARNDDTELSPTACFTNLVTHLEQCESRFCWDDGEGGLICSSAFDYCAQAAQTVLEDCLSRGTETPPDEAPSDSLEPDSE